jgi:hypothetical protein
MESVFFDFHLPNATTWFYVSAIICVALFFRFSRPLSLLNLDLALFFLPMPGFLLLLEAKGPGRSFAWLVASSAIVVARCVLDVGFFKRVFAPSNINVSGLVWISVSLFVGLVAVTLDVSNQRHPGPDTSRFPVEAVRTSGEEVIKAQASEPLSQVRFWTERSLSLACHISILTALIMFAWRHFGSALTGVVLATIHLLLPYCYLLIPYNPLGVGRWEDTWPMALILWALFWIKIPWLAGGLIGLSIGTVVFPAFIVPAWIAYYGLRKSLLFLSAGTLMGIVCLAGLGLSGFYPTFLASRDWIPWCEPNQSSESLWVLIPWAYRIPLFVLHLVITVWPLLRFHHGDLARLLAQTTAALAAIQWWLADRGGVHVLWFWPLFLLVAFRPPMQQDEPADSSSSHEDNPSQTKHSNRPSRRGPLGFLTRKRKES